MLVNFENDYLEGAHPKILDKLLKTNMEQLSGYGNDFYTKSAIEKIKKLIKNPNAEIVLICGGTQTNLIAIRNTLKPFEGVIAATTGHINTLEAGAIEATGHKILTLNSSDGKIYPQELKSYLEKFYNNPHNAFLVYPGMVFISNPTEFGTLYTKSELKSLYEICKSYNILLYLDGARLGYGLMSDASDLTIADIAEYTDMFYIGGTKIGALIGEALIFTKKKLDNLITRVKQSGALLAKGRLLGIQFDTLFTDNLYFEISKHAIRMSNLLKKGLIEKGFDFYIDSPTNQQFVIIENSRYINSKQFVNSFYWCKYDDTRSVIRLATSWATSEESILKLLDII